MLQAKLFGNDQQKLFSISEHKEEYIIFLTENTLQLFQKGALGRKTLG